VLMPHLNCMLVYFVTPVVDRADIKTCTPQSDHALACCILYTSVNVTKCLKFLVPKWSIKVQKVIWWWSRKWHRDHSGTEMDMYRNALPRGPEMDRYRTWPTPLHHNSMCQQYSAEEIYLCTEYFLVAVRI